MKIFLQITLLVILSMLVKTNSVCALGDTDALLSEGLFPIQKGGSSLILVSEKIDTIINVQSVSTTISYIIKNDKNAGSYSFGFILPRGRDRSEFNFCPQKDEQEELLRSLKVLIDNKPISFKTEQSRLCDRWSYIETGSHAVTEGNKCRSSEDAVCGHSWASFTSDFDVNQTKTVTIAYTFEKNIHYNQKVAMLPYKFYIEKFWAGATVSKIEFNLQIRELNLPETLFAIPLSDNCDLEPSTTIRDGVVSQIFNDVKPVSTDFLNCFAHNYRPIWHYIKEKYSPVFNNINYDFIDEDARTEAISLFQEALKDGNHVVRQYALEFIGKLREDDKKKKAVLLLLNDKFPNVRALAADILGGWGVKEAVEPLKKLLNDDDPRVKTSAAKALAKISANR